MSTLTDADLRQTIIDTLRRIAPEVAAGDLAPATPLRDQVDLDSMDWLNFLVGLHAKLGIDIPESDYAKLVALDDLVAYAKTKLGHAQAARAPRHGPPSAAGAL